MDAEENASRVRTLRGIFYAIYTHQYQFKLAKY